MDKKRLFNILKVVLKIGFTCLLLFFVFSKINFSDVKKSFLESDPVYLSLALVVYFISQVMSSWRLLSFLRSINLNVSFGFNFRLYLLGLFYNVFLPGGIGGDGYKIYLLKKKFQLPTKKIFSALFFDRLSGLWAIGFICVALIIFIPAIGIPPVYPLLALSAGTLIYYGVIRYFFAEHAENFIVKHLKAGLTQALQLTSIIFILLSQGFAGKFSPYLFSFLVSSIATILPISLGGVGIREFVMTHTSKVFDMDQNLAVLVTLTFTLISIAVAMFGVYYVYRSKEFEPAPHEDELKKADLEDLETNL